eukprot:2170884-Rhodomonas_salina.1
MSWGFRLEKEAAALNLEGYFDNSSRNSVLWAKNTSEGGLLRFGVLRTGCLQNPASLWRVLPLSLSGTRGTRVPGYRHRGHLGQSYATVMPGGVHRVFSRIPGYCRNNRLAPTQILSRRLVHLTDSLYPGTWTFSSWVPRYGGPI